MYQSIPYRRKRTFHTPKYLQPMNQSMKILSFLSRQKRQIVTNLEIPGRPRKFPFLLRFQTMSQVHPYPYLYQH